MFSVVVYQHRRPTLRCLGLGCLPASLKLLSHAHRAVSWYCFVFLCQKKNAKKPGPWKKLFFRNYSQRIPQTKDFKNHRRISPVPWLNSYFFLNYLTWKFGRSLAVVPGGIYESKEVDKKPDIRKFENVGRRKRFSY